ncbi:MAG: peroxiredoxin-like family protein [Candidatus Krumholzibacteriia bacterium]
MRRWKNRMTGLPGSREPSDFRRHLPARLAIIVAAAAVLTIGVAAAQSAGWADTSRPGSVADRPEDICPILVGSELPPIELRTPTGAAFDLNAAARAQPTVLIFYRGGWCPFCSRHLAQLQTVQQDLSALGYQILAVSADRPAKLTAPVEEHDLEYQLLSDSTMAAARALGIAFEVPDETVQKYKNDYNIDLEADSGETHHQLPVPAAIVLDREGMVRFIHVDPDYRSRIDPELLLAAARVALEKEKENEQ